VRRSRSRARSNASSSARERRTPGSTWSALTTSEPSLRSDFRSARRRSDRARGRGARSSRSNAAAQACTSRSRARSRATRCPKRVSQSRLSNGERRTAVVGCGRSSSIPPRRRSAHGRPLRRAARASRRGRPSTGATANGGAHLLTLPEDAALQGRPNTICASPTAARQGFRLPDCPAGRASRSLRRRTGPSRSLRFHSGSRQEFLAARRSAMARACRPR